MIKLMDRQMIRGYFKAYFVCLTSLLSLYVVVDLFTNLDDFTHHGKGFVTTLHHIATYYGYKVTQIFDRLCEAIVLLAAMFTVAWMQRSNEQMPLLSAGVSTHRIVAPALICAGVMLTLAVLNQELVIPRVADQLGHAKDDPGGQRSLSVRGQFDGNGVHVEGDEALRRGLTVRPFRVTIPEGAAANLAHLIAREAHYIPEGPRGGRWELTGTQTWPADQESIPDLLERVDAGRYLLHTRDVDFDALTRNPNWYQLASTWRLYDELEKPESTRLAPMAVLFHKRLTRPLLGLLLVFLGLSVILRDQNRNVFVSSGVCLVLCGVFFAVSYICQLLGDNDYLAPALAAWLPVLLFGPLALVMFDAVHT
jgi:lipopolysaccharide export system permease protein